MNRSASGMVSRFGRALSALCAGLLVLAGCEQGRTPTDTETASFPTASHEIVDGAHGDDGNSHFYFLPPLVPEPDFSGDFDPDVFPVVEICLLEGGGCGISLASFTPLGRTRGSERVRVDEDDEHYVVNWHTGRFLVGTGDTVRIRVRVGSDTLGHVDVRVVGGGEGRDLDRDRFGVVTRGQTLPVKFRIEDGALCTTDDGCTTATVTQEGGTVEFESDAETGDVTVGGIRIPEDALPPGVDAINVVAEFIPNDELDDRNPDVSFDKFPYGFNLRFEPDVVLEEPAVLTVCQSPDLDDPTSEFFLDPSLHDDLRILQDDDGVVELKDPAPPGTTPAADCSEDGGGGLGASEMLGRVFAFITGARPLVAAAPVLHGGLNTTIVSTSDFYAVEATPEDRFYDTAGNTELIGGAFTAPATPHVVDPDNLLSTTPGLTAVAETKPTAHGGTVTIEEDGDFDYVPAPGDAGPDTFSYSVTTGDQATVAVSMVEMTWYVDNQAGAGAGSGLSNDPFGELALAPSAAAAGQRIFVHAGDGTTTGQDQGIVLLDDQKLIGEGVGLTIDRFGTLVPAGAAPKITSPDDAVLMASGNTVAGIDIVAPGVHGILASGSADGTITAVNVEGPFRGMLLDEATGSWEVSACSVTDAENVAFWVIAGAATLSVADCTFTSARQAALGVDELDGTATFSNVVADGQFWVGSGYDWIYANGEFTRQDRPGPSTTVSFVGGSIQTSGSVRAVFPGTVGDGVADITLDGTRVTAGENHAVSLTTAQGLWAERSDTLRFSMHGGSVIEGGRAGLGLEPGQGALVARIDNTTFRSNEQWVLVENWTGAPDPSLDLTIMGNTFETPVSSGMNLRPLNNDGLGGVWRVVIADNVMQGGGIDFREWDIHEEIDFTIENNDIDLTNPNLAGGAAPHGIRIDAGSPSICLNLQGNEVTQSFEEEYLIRPSTPGFFMERLGDPPYPTTVTDPSVVEAHILSENNLLNPGATATVRVNNRGITGVEDGTCELPLLP